MTVGIVEGLSSTIGEELTAWVGVRSSRLVAQFLAAITQQTALNTSSGTAGSVTPIVGRTWTWDGTTTVVSDDGDTSGLSVTDLVRLDGGGVDSDGVQLPERLFEITSINPGVSFDILPHPGGQPIPTSVPDQVVPYDPVPQNTISVVVPTVVTLSSGTYLASIDDTMLHRLLSGSLSGTETLIRTRDSGTQLTLEDAVGALWAAESWEIETPAEEDLTAESLLDWPLTDGRIILQGTTYTYQVRVGNVLRGLSYTDAGVTFSGAREDYDPLTELVDFTKIYSALDVYRRSFLVDYATGEDLNVVGRNLGVDRPPALLDDDLFRRLIKAIAYAPRGTLYSIELALTAIFGGDWELFEDHTGQIVNPFRFRDFTDVANGVGIERGHPCTVFLRRSDDNEEDPNGKTFLDGEELVPTTGPSTLSLASAPIQVQGLTLADDPGERLIQTGRCAITLAGSVASASAGTFHIKTAGVVSVSAGQFSTLVVDTGIFTAGDIGRQIRLRNMANPVNNGEFIIDTFTNATTVSVVNVFTMVAEGAGGTGIITNLKPDDIFTIIDGKFSGQTATVLDYDRTVSQDLVDLFVSGSAVAPASGGVAYDEFSQATKDTDPIDVGYKITRPKSNFRFTYPSSEYYLDPAGVPTQQWQYNDAPVFEAQEVFFIQNHPTYGNYLAVSDPGVADDATYTHALRIQPESKAKLNILVGNIGLGSLPTDFLQWAFQIHDGERNLCIGFRFIGAGNMEAALVDANGGTGGTQIPGTTTFVFSILDFRSFTLVKDGRGRVALYHGSDFVTSADYAAFDTTTQKEIRWGVLEGGLTGGGGGAIKHMDWVVDNVKDMWNAFIPNGQTTAPNVLTDGGSLGLFLAADATNKKRVRIKDFTTPNGSGGTPLGEWEILAFANTNQVTLIGPTKPGATFTVEDPSRLTIRGDPQAFNWPNHRGHSIEILTGVNAGIYPILEILDPKWLINVEEPVQNPNEAVPGLSVGQVIVSTDPNDETPNPVATDYSIRVTATSGGGSGFFVKVVDLQIGGAIILTGFSGIDAGSMKQMELVPTFGYLKPNNPFNGTLILKNIDPPIGNGLTILELPPGKFSIGKPQMVLNHAALTGASDIQQTIYSNAVLLDTAAGTPPRPNGFTDTDEEAEWRIIPNFALDTGPVPYEIVDAGSAAGAVLTTRQDLTAVHGVATGELVSVGRTTVLSAQTLDEAVDIALTSPGPPAVLSHYAFWLADNFGQNLRELIDLLTAAGVIADFDSFFRDATGVHIA